MNRMNVRMNVRNRIVPDPRAGHSSGMSDSTRREASGAGVEGHVVFPTTVGVLGRDRRRTRKLRLGNVGGLTACSGRSRRRSYNGQRPHASLSYQPPVSRFQGALQ